MRTLLLGALLMVFIGAPASAKIPPREQRRLAARVAQNANDITQKTDSLAIKYRQLDAAISMATADGKFENRELPKTTGPGENDQSHAVRTNHHLRSLEVDTLKNEIRQLKGEIAHLQAQSSRLRRKLQKNG